MEDILKVINDNSIVDNQEIIANQINSEIEEQKNEITYEELKEENNKLQLKLFESENKYKYLLADLDNIKKRYNKILSDKEKYEGFNIFSDIIIDILDYIDLVMKSETSDTINISELDTIVNKILIVLNKYGVDLIYNNERPAYFNPEYDNAIFSLKTQDKQLDNSINDVIKKGYKMKDKIIRHEQVSINKFEE